MNKLQIISLIVAGISAVIGYKNLIPHFSPVFRFIFFLAMLTFFNSVLSKYLKL